MRKLVLIIALAMSACAVDIGDDTSNVEQFLVCSPITRCSPGASGNLFCVGECGLGSVCLATSTGNGNSGVCNSPDFKQP